MTRPAAAPLARTLPLYLLIAALPFCDFLQTGIVAFNAAPVMGDIGASPEEYSGSRRSTAWSPSARSRCTAGWSSAWAGAACCWRRARCSRSVRWSADSPPACCNSRLGRALMALGCASFMTAGRVLVNRIPPSPRRFTGIRFFAAGLAWGIAAGPLLASLALAASGWRAGLPAAAAAGAAAGAAGGAGSWTTAERRAGGPGALATDRLAGADGRQLPAAARDCSARASTSSPTAGRWPRWPRGAARAVAVRLARPPARPRR